MTYDSWKTTEPEPDYVPDEEPPVEMDDADLYGADYPDEMLAEDDPLVHLMTAMMSYADRADLDASITLALTAPDGSVVTVTKESAKRLGRLRQ